MTGGRERVIFAKFSTSRSRANSVKTVLSKADGEIAVRKIPLFPEAGETLQEMYEKKELLPKAFLGCGVCGCRKEGDALRFDYIRGESLAATYWRAYQTNDLDLFYANIERHKALLFSNLENQDFFTPSDEYTAFFGSRYPYEGLEALKCTNFEATAFNIIFEEGTDKPIFFDYECIYDFPMPADLVKYHCIYRTLYLCMPFLRSFVKPEDFLSRLDLQVGWKQLEKSWKNWRKNFSFGSKKVALPLPEQTREASDDEERILTQSVAAQAPSAEPAPGDQAAESGTAEEITAAEPEHYVTLSEVKSHYAKRFYEVNDLSMIRSSMKRKQKMKRFLKKVLPAPVFSLVKWTYRSAKRKGKGR